MRSFPRIISALMLLGFWVNVQIFANGQMEGGAGNSQYPNGRTIHGIEIDFSNDVDFNGRPSSASTNHFIDEIVSLAKKKADPQENEEYLRAIRTILLCQAMSSNKLEDYKQVLTRGFNRKALQSFPNLVSALKSEIRFFTEYNNTLGLQSVSKLKEYGALISNNTFLNGKDKFSDYPMNSDPLAFDSIDGLDNCNPKNFEVTSDDFDSLVRNGISKLEDSPAYQEQKALREKENAEIKAKEEKEKEIVLEKKDKESLEVLYHQIIESTASIDKVIKKRGIQGEFWNYPIEWIEMKPGKESELNDVVTLKELLAFHALNTEFSDFDIEQNSFSITYTVNFSGNTRTAQFRIKNGHLILTGYQGVSEDSQINLALTIISLLRDDYFNESDVWRAISWGRDKKYYPSAD